MQASANAKARTDSFFILTLFFFVFQVSLKFFKQFQDLVSVSGYLL